MIQSGNYKDNLELPIYLNARKGMKVQFYYGEDKIIKIFCYGVIYEF